MTELSQNLIDAELAKHGVKPAEKKPVTVTDCADLPKPTVEEKADREAIEKKIKDLQKQSTFSLKVSGEQKQMLTRIAQSSGMKDWKEALLHEINTKVFNQAISEPRIGAPSWAREVVAPTNGWGDR